MGYILMISGIGKTFPALVPSYVQHWPRHTIICSFQIQFLINFTTVTTSYPLWYPMAHDKLLC